MAREDGLEEDSRIFFLLVTHTPVGAQYEQTNR